MTENNKSTEPIPAQAEWKPTSGQRVRIKASWLGPFYAGIELVVTRVGEFRAYVKPHHRLSDPEPSFLFSDIEPAPVEQAECAACGEPSCQNPCNLRQKTRRSGEHLCDVAIEARRATKTPTPQQGSPERADSSSVTEDAAPAAAAGPAEDRKPWDCEIYTGTVEWVPLDQRVAVAKEELSQSSAGRRARLHEGRSCRVYSVNRRDEK